MTRIKDFLSVASVVTRKNGQVADTGSPGMNGDYSGGVENSLRMLENWSSQTLTYNGSIVVLCSSRYATNCWRETGEYYTAPTPHWAFDWNFQNYGKLPPLTPAVKNYVSP